jgi:hypothetical protein
MYIDYMLTKDDKKFLKDNFSTKDDLKAFATKDDLKSLAKQKDLLEVKKTLKDLSDYAIPALGNLFRWTDDIHAAVTGKN